METAGGSTRARHEWNVTFHNSCATWHLEPLCDECQLSHTRARWLVQSGNIMLTKVSLASRPQPWNI